MYLHLMRKNKVVQVLIVDDESFLKQNYEFIKSEFEFDSFTYGDIQECDIGDEFIEKENKFTPSKERFAPIEEEQKLLNEKIGEQ